MIGYGVKWWWWTLTLLAGVFGVWVSNLTIVL
jgi:hypothetical protein